MTGFVELSNPLAVESAGLVLDGEPSLTSSEGTDLILEASVGQGLTSTLNILNEILPLTYLRQSESQLIQLRGHLSDHSYYEA